MGSLKVQELSKFLFVNAIIHADWIPILPLKVCGINGPIAAVWLLKVPHGHENTLVVMYKGLYHQVPNHFRIDQDRLNVVFARVINHKIQEITLCLEMT